jgi:hypothetical protein
MVGGLVFVALFAMLILFGDDETPAAPTPSGGTPVAAPSDDVVVVGVGAGRAISLTVDAPASLALDSQMYALQPQVIETTGEWTALPAQEGVGTWVYGTVINYVIGLPDTPENRAALDQLTTEDTLVLTTRGGETYNFTFNSRDVVGQNNRDIFGQTRPGITVVLLGPREDDNGQRLVVTGRYAAAAAPEDDGGRGVVELGETAALNGLEITVTGSTFQFDRPEAPAGFDFFLVDFEIANRGSTAVDVTTLRAYLTDTFGNQYALNPLASQLGNYPPLNGILSPGQTTVATAGYQIPAGLNAAQLSWVVVQSDTGEQIQVRIPFGGGGAAVDAAVTLQQAEVSMDGASLLLFGQLTNNGMEQLVVTEEDVALGGNGTVYLILSTNPGFPWVVDPGQTINYSVAFQRPQTASAIFSVLGREFELTGLQ